MEWAQRSDTNKEKEDQNRTVESCQLPCSEVNIEGVEDEYWPLSGRPYFSVILSKTYVKPVYHLHIPYSMSCYFPHGTARLVIKYCGQEWHATCCGKNKPKIVIRGWKAFVDDNNLKAGDALVFELRSSCPKVVKLRAQILRGDLPAEMQKKIDGSSYESAIPVD